MRRKFIAALIVTAIPVLLTGTALGGEGVQVKILNDGTQDIVVTVYDMNVRPERVVLENAHINGFTSVPINAIADAMGKARISWTATSTDGTSRKCGHDDTVSVNNDGSVTVHAEGSCSV